MKTKHVIEPKIVVGGLTPLTTIDYPGELACVMFLQGCPWRCGYCQNSDLLPRKCSNTIDWPEIMEFLARRQGLLDAVVFSGGEPLLHSGLIQAMQLVRSMGYKIGLHTAGIYPQRLQRLLPLVNWVGMDIKAAQNDYESITGIKGSGDRAWQSAQLLIKSGVDHEFRTTVHPDMLSEAQLSKLVEELTAIGATNYVVQECVTDYCLDKEKRTTSTRISTPALVNRYSYKFESFTVRAA